MPVANVRLSLESRAESVALVRAMLSGANEELLFGPELLADLKTAVSEACNNVVVHAYRDRAAGPLTVTLCDLGDTITVTVADRGSGLRDDAPPSDGLGVGLAVIDALVEHAEFRSQPDVGTEVEMVFSRARGEHPEARREPGSDPPRPTGPPAPDAAGVGGELPAEGEILLSVEPAGLLGGILGRVAGALVAEAAFSLDRYSDVYLVTDSVAAHARDHSQGPELISRLRPAARRLDVEVGPFEAGSLAALQPGSRDASPALLSMLVDDLGTVSRDGGELLRMVLTDDRQPGAAER